MYFVIEEGEDGTYLLVPLEVHDNAFVATGVKGSEGETVWRPRPADPLRNMWGGRQWRPSAPVQRQTV